MLQVTVQLPVLSTTHRQPKNSETNWNDPRWTLNQIYVTKVVNEHHDCKTNRKCGCTISVRRRGGWKASYNIAIEMAGWTNETPTTQRDWLQFQCVQCWWYLTPEWIKHNFINLIKYFKGQLDWALSTLNHFWGLMVVFLQIIKWKLHACCSLAIWDNSFPGFWVYPHWGFLSVWLGCSTIISTPNQLQGFRGKHWRIICSLASDRIEMFLSEFFQKKWYRLWQGPSGILDNIFFKSFISYIYIYQLPDCISILVWDWSCMHICRLNSPINLGHPPFRSFLLRCCCNEIGPFKEEGYGAFVVWGTTLAVSWLQLASFRDRLYCN